MRSRRERVNRRTVSERSVARTTSREWATRVCDKRAKWAPHYDYMDMAAWKASGIGYQIDLAGLGHRSGNRNEVYFNSEGRKLNPIIKDAFCQI